MKRIKRAISTMMAVVFLLSACPVALAESNFENGYKLISEETNKLEKYTMTKTVELLNSVIYTKEEKDFGNYKIIQGNDGTNFVELDTRDNFIIQNGEKIYYNVVVNTTVESDIKSLAGSSLLRASDSWGVDTDKWGYINTYTYLIQSSSDIGDLTTIALNLLILRFFPAANAALVIADVMVVFARMNHSFGNSKNAYYNNRRYGYKNVVSQFAFVEWGGDQNNTYISGAMRKHNPTVFPF